MITITRFRRIEQAVRQAGYGEDIQWSETIDQPTSPEQFAEAAIYVICNSGMAFTVAASIVEKCYEAVRAGAAVSAVFGHPGKAAAIEHVWYGRVALYAAYIDADDKLEFCQSLPWIGPVTKFHLAKDLGVDVAKPDVHLVRLARAEQTTVARMCARLARLTGYRIATVDTVLWRACSTGILNSRRYLQDGWRSSFRGTPRTSS